MYIKIVMNEELLAAQRELFVRKKVKILFIVPVYYL